MSAHRKILLGLALGAGLGIAANVTAADARWLAELVRLVTDPAGKIFVRLLLMLVIPVIFSALVVGVSELDLRHLGRLGGRTLGITVVLSVTAALIGLGLVNAIRPGDGASQALRDNARAAIGPATTTLGFGSPVDLLLSLVPTNPLQAAASGDMIGFIVFSALFGVGLALTRTPAAESLRGAIAGLLDVSLRLIDLVLRLAPFGVAALLFTTTARTGPAVIRQLAAYVGVVLLGLALHLFVVYGIGVRFVGGMAPRRFFRDIRLAMLTAFSTASSSATLPTALRVAEENLALPRHVSRFVLTAGATMNQNGTALFEGVTVLFLAQVYGVELGFSKQAIVMGICVLAGIGTAGVPSGSMPVIATVLTTLGIPAEGIGIVIGVDRLLDMSRTTVNVAGDLAAAVMVARGEPQEPDGRDDHAEAPA